jgi:hypothetical protein
MTLLDFLYNIDTSAIKMLASASVASVEVADPVETAPGVPIPPGLGAPGLLMSPANAEMLSARDRKVAVQIAFIFFMIFSPIRFFRVIRLIKAVEHEGGKPTAGLLQRGASYPDVNFLARILAS